MRGASSLKPASIAAKSTYLLHLHIPPFRPAFSANSDLCTPSAWPITKDETALTYQSAHLRRVRTKETRVMVRVYKMGSVVVGLAASGLAWGQAPLAPPPAAEPA